MFHSPFPQENWGFWCVWMDRKQEMKRNPFIPIFWNHFTALISLFFSFLSTIFFLFNWVSHFGNVVAAFGVLEWSQKNSFHTFAHILSCLNADNPTNSPFFVCFSTKKHFYNRMQLNTFTKCSFWHPRKTDDDADDMLFWRNNGKCDCCKVWLREIRKRAHWFFQKKIFSSAQEFKHIPSTPIPKKCFFLLWVSTTYLSHKFILTPKLMKTVWIACWMKYPERREIRTVFCLFYCYYRYLWYFLLDTFSRYFFLYSLS